VQRKDAGFSCLRLRTRLTRLTWSSEFEDPIPGMTTLQDAADHILKLPKATQQLPHWQAGTEALILAAEGRGPLLHARVGMLRAMNHGVERVYSDSEGHALGQAEAGWLKPRLRLIQRSIQRLARFPDAACRGFFVACAHQEAPLVRTCYAHI
jgi:hypothetical protein